MAKDKPVADKAKKPKSMTKNELLNHIAEATELKKAEVAKVYDALSETIIKQLGTKGPGVLALPGLFKLVAKRMPAVKGGAKVPNRFKPGEMTVTKSKPAHTKVRATALKSLKELVK